MGNSSEKPSEETEKMHMRHEEESLEVLEDRLAALNERLETILRPDVIRPPQAIEHEKERIEEEISYISKTIESKKAKS